jgi:signal peptidase II
MSFKLNSLFKLNSPFFVCLVVFVADQLSKELIVRNFEFGDSMEIIPGFFHFTLIGNYGAAFGIFRGLPDGTRQLVLAAVSLIALVVVFKMLYSKDAQDLLSKLSLGAILGGAFGNILDRIRFGKVIDFLDFFIGEYHYPAFNLADSAICLGVALLILKTYLEKDTSKVNNINNAVY